MDEHRQMLALRAAALIQLRGLPQYLSLGLLPLPSVVPLYFQAVRHYIGGRSSKGTRSTTEVHQPLCFFLWFPQFGSLRHALCQRNDLEKN